MSIKIYNCLKNFWENLPSPNRCLQYLLPERSGLCWSKDEYLYRFSTYKQIIRYCCGSKVITEVTIQGYFYSRLRVNTIACDTKVIQLIHINHLCISNLSQKLKISLSDEVKRNQKLCIMYHFNVRSSSPVQLCWPPDDCSSALK